MTLIHFAKRKKSLFVHICNVNKMGGLRGEKCIRRHNYLFTDFDGLFIQKSRGII